MTIAVYDGCTLMAMDRRELAPDARMVQELLRPISQDRLEKYRPLAGSDLDMLTNYYWNIALSQALYPILSCVEVALRNTMHMTFTDRYGTEFWFDDLAIVRPEQRRDAQAAREKLIRQGQDQTAGKIVAELNFGFWVQMLTKYYESRIWRDDQFTPMLTAFPHVPRRYRNRSHLHARYRDANLFRNRVFHVEPVWNSPHLQQRYRNALDAIGWISPRQHDAVRLFDTFQAVYEDGRAETRAKISGYLVGWET